MIAAAGKCWYDYDIPQRKFEMFGVPVFVVPGHPRARAEALMSTSAAALPWSLARCWRRHPGNSEDDQKRGETS